MKPKVSPILEESFPTGKITKLKQTSTKEDEPNPFIKLKGYEQKAIDMRIALIPYSIIQKELKSVYNKDVEEQTIRRWFMEGMPCKEALKWREKQLEKDELEKSDKAYGRLVALAYDAIGMLNDGLIKDRMSQNQIRIAQDILDRTGYPKTSKVEGKHDVDVHESQQFTNAIVDIANSLKNK